ncbi:AI-2E family transporter [Tetragenococcus osmophilus]|uniref:AI-2E family transporter n=1 Tax=Tetragenococcus osmophilus TaxID=526944 RepID=A0ABM7A9B6_9ENTE|nr:AI-2E family transporter [Tetragenococcus osmophilus]AYW48031.1 AI-2E family transporter [Tetragenococcus osmophilus]
MDKKEKRPFSWFWKWFLDNKFVTGLLIIFLILININLFTKVSYLFFPVWQFLAIVALPIILAGILFYLLNPIVNFFEKRGIRRIYSIIGLFILVAGLIAWGVVVIIPEIREQTTMFIDRLPGYIDTAQNAMDNFFSDPVFDKVQDQITISSERIMSSMTDMVQNLSRTTVQSIGNFFGAVASIFIAIVTMPVILFYLLKDGKKIAPYFVQFLPTKMRQPTLRVLREMNQQVSSYIRGQLTVAFAVAILFMIGFSIIGLDYAITLGVIAGFLNLVPYIGSFLAMVPAIFLGIVGGPVLLIKVLVVFAIEQAIEGRLISPLVLGNQLAIHPVTILFVLLTAGQLFGFFGVVLGVPAYAALKVVITNIFNWYKTISGLYTDEEKIPGDNTEESEK